MAFCGRFSRPRKGQKHYAGCFAELSSAEHRARELWRDHGAALEAESVLPVPRACRGCRVPGSRWVFDHGGDQREFWFMVFVDVFFLDKI